MTEHGQGFLDEAFEQARDRLSGWAYAALVAKSENGTDPSAQLSFIEKLALAEIRPATLRDLQDSELQELWLKLNAQFAELRENKRPIENAVNAGLWLQNELRSRKLDVSATDLSKEIDKLRAVRKDAGVDEGLMNLPRDIVVVPDFVSMVGSVVTGSKEPDDIDLVVRAKKQGEDFLVSTQNVWVPLRNILDPDKKDRLSFIPNPQGPNDDNVPLYDLVLRKKEEIKTAVIKGFPNETPEGGIHVHNLERENKITKQDGGHRHLFMLPDGTSKWTEVDGEHTHDLSSDTANLVSDSGAHTHKLILADGTEVLTDEDGTHEHQMQGWSSAFDGIHTHKLKLSGGEVLETILPGQYWEQRGKPPQADVPPAPDAEVLGDRADLVDGVEKQKIYKQTVPTIGPEGARVMFVGACPDLIEEAREEPFTGPVGDTFNQIYLKELGLPRGEIALTNVIRKTLLDGNGKLREPTPDEMESHREEFVAELQRIHPDIVVALGKTVKKALEHPSVSGLAEVYSMPHPAAVMKFGDRGEVGRKIKAIRKALSSGRFIKQQPQRLDEGGEDTQEKEANEQWFERWHERLPKSGKGKFVYQHHWRGLEDGETRLNDNELLHTGNSLHGDLRLEGNECLWGWAVLIGSAEKNQDKNGGDKFLSMKPGGDSLRLATKLQQPEQWLDVGRSKPLIAGPGGVGSTSEKSSKFFALDHGTFELGVARRSSVEIFLDGQQLKGRYLLKLADAEGKRFWLIDKPEDQTPTAETKELADVIRELKKKRQDFLIWSKPGDRPQKIDVRTRKIEKSIEARFLKASRGKKIVSAVVLDPYEVDDHGDWVQPRVIRDTAHEWMKSSRVIAVGHTKTADAQAVESHQVHYPSQEDYDLAMAGRPHRAYRMKYGNDIVHSGAWILDTELSAKLMRQVESGELTGYSIGGFGHKTPIGRETMTEVEFIDLDQFQRNAA